MDDYKMDRGFYNKYKNYILFNKNILISGIFAFFGGAFFTQIYARYYDNNIANSLITLSFEYGIYIPLFMLLYYMDNRQLYEGNSIEKKNYSRIKKDIKKLITVFSVSELIYSFTKILIHFELLQSHIEPYQASMIASIVAWTIFMTSINLSIKAVKLFHSK